MADGRYYGYRGYVDPSEMQQMSGANPWYNPLMERPDWGAGIRSMLNQITAIKEQRRQQQEEQRRWDIENSRAQQQAQSDLQYRQVQIQKILEKEPGPEAVNRPAIKGFLVQNMGWPKEQADSLDGLTDNQLQEIFSVVTKTKYGEQPKQPTPKEPTEYDKRLSGLQEALKSGKITQEQYNQAALGVQQPTSPSGLTPYQNINTQRNIKKDVTSAVTSLIESGTLKAGETISGIDANSLRNYVKKLGAERGISPDGIVLDVPSTYRYAKANIENGVGSPKDQEMVDYYDSAWQVFATLSNFTSYDDFVKRGSKNPALLKMIQDPSVDKDLLKFWFKIYR